MIATPIIPGRLYRVRFAGVCGEIIARNGMAAIQIVFARVFPCAD